MVQIARRAAGPMSPRKPNELAAKRLTLRQWQAGDKPAFAALNADPRVMEFFPRPLSQAESNAGVDRLHADIERRGWGFWAVEIRHSHEFIGMVGISEPDNLPFSPCVEIGWRLAFPHWGKGYASEAAACALDFGFDELALAEIVSFTPLVNLPSAAVMRKIGMRDSGRTFAHPSITAGDKLSLHCLYKITRNDWSTQRNT